MALLKPRTQRWLCGVAALAVASLGCSTKKHRGGGGPAAANADGASALPPSGIDAPLGDASPGLSSHPDVRYKKLRLLRTDFSQALRLPQDQLCTESGHDCFNNYQVILGSNDLKLTLYKTAEPPTLSTAVAVERIAVQACARRVEQDLAGKPVIFSGVGASAATYTPAMAQAAATLYQNFLQRQPTAVEADALKDLFTGVLASTGPNTAGKTWAKLACWSVATSLEFVLY